jgi:uncharacterized protein
MSAIIQNKASLLRELSGHADKIKNFGVARLGLFGSFARDVDINSESDVDFLIEFEPGKETFDNFMDLSFYLEEILGRRIELITPNSLSKYIGRHILKTVENVSI